MYPPPLKKKVPKNQYMLQKDNETASSKTMSSTAAHSNSENQYGVKKNAKDHSSDCVDI